MRISRIISLFTVLIIVIVAITRSSAQSDNGSSSEPCPGIPTITDPRDGQVYPTVQIGDQCWMAKNFNIGKMIQKKEIQADNGIIEKYCYEDNVAYCHTYGGLYQWDELMQYGTIEKAKGICPLGWHVPSDAEWTKLIDFLGGKSVAADKMKSSSGWSNNGNGLNSSGFTALPGGNRSNDGRFYNLTYGAYFWSSTKNSSANAWIRNLAYDRKDVGRNKYNKAYGWSVRCLRDI